MVQIFWSTSSLQIQPTNFSSPSRNRRFARGAEPFSCRSFDARSRYLHASFNDARGWFRRHGGTRDNTPQTFGHFHRRFPRGTGENSGGRLELPKILWASLSIVVKQLSSCQGQPFETGKSSEIFAKREGFLRPATPFALK